MWLIDAVTLKLHSFDDIENTPPYLILSHRWTDEEITFQELQRSYDGATTAVEVEKFKSKAGYRKVESFCRMARQEGICFVWVDTCCIDKSSSAELSEAINSMYKWYYRARACFVYLPDVVGVRDAGTGMLTLDSCTKSQWFSRGWTLQELLAPEFVYFYDAEWNFLGTKASELKLLQTITGISFKALRDRDSVQHHSVACRMSWAAQRTTSRKEDLAYCLMGLFDVNMPMLYGEGEKAFLRLQEEILRTSDDHSIFAWTDPTADDEKCGGLLARSPALFQDSGDIEEFHLKMRNPRVVTQTNIGLKLKLPVAEMRMINGVTDIMATLCCTNKRRNGVRVFPLCIHLTCHDVYEARFSRVKMSVLEPNSIFNGDLHEFYVSHPLTSQLSNQRHFPKQQLLRFRNRIESANEQGLEDWSRPQYWLAPGSDICGATPKCALSRDVYCRLWAPLSLELIEQIGGEAFNSRAGKKKQIRSSAAIPLSWFLNTPAVVLGPFEDKFLLFGRSTRGGVGVQEMTLSAWLRLVRYEPRFATNNAKLEELGGGMKVVLSHWPAASLTTFVEYSDEGDHVLCTVTLEKKTLRDLMPASQS